MSKRRSPTRLKSDMTDAAKDARRASSWILRIFGGRFGVLLFALLVFLLISPLVIEGRLPHGILAIFGSVVLIASVHAARPAGWAWMIGVGLAVADFITGRIVALEGGRGLIVIQAALWISSLLFVIKAILDVMFRSRKVDVETLQAALCVYLLMGLLWAYAYATINLAYPSSFETGGQALTMWTDDSTRLDSFLHFLLFSFATQTSAPYDGLAPRNGFTNMCSFLQAMTAQVYLAVVIARLVAIQAADISEGRQ